MGDDVLVRGDDVLAHRERGRDQRVRRLVAAHQLDDDVDGVVGHEVRRGVAERGRPAGRDPTARATSRTAMADQLQGRSAGRPQLGGAIEQGARDLVPDGPRAEHGDAQPGAAHRWHRTGDGIGRNGSRRRTPAEMIEG